MMSKPLTRLELCVLAGKTVDPEADKTCACSERLCWRRSFPAVVRPDQDCQTCPKYRTSNSQVKGCNCH